MSLQRLSSRELYFPNHCPNAPRIGACFDELQRAGLLDGCKRFPVRNAMEFELESVHTPSWIKKVHTPS